MATISHKWFCGVDLHEQSAQVCIRDSHGEVAEERRFSLRRASVRDEFLDWIEGRGSVRVAVEALGLNRWFVDGLKARGLKLNRDLRVVHAASLKLRESGKKTDRRDAQEIARRLWLGDLDRVGRAYYPSTSSYDDRQLLRTRHDLMKTRLHASNQVRSFFRAYALSLPRTLHSRSSVAWLREHVSELPAGRSAAGACVEVLALAQQQIDALSEEVKQRAQRRKSVLTLMALPEVAEQTALTILSELGDIRRFDNSRSVASYAGLTPRVANSGDTQWHGRLDTRGNRQLRWIMGQWAVRLMGKHPEVKQWAAKRAHRMPQNRIRTALARRLLVGVYASMRDGVPFSLTRCLGG